MERIKRALESEQLTVSSLKEILIELFGKDVLTWEAETIIDAAEDDLAIDIPEINEEKIMSLCFFTKHPHVYFNERVFLDTVSVWNDESSSPFSINEVDPHEICWAIEELKKLETEGEVEFEDNIKDLIAMIFHHNGFLMMPDDLSYLQGNLDTFNKNTDAVKVIRQAWNKVKGSYEPTNDGSLLDEQLKKLKSCTEYLNIKRNQSWK